MGKVVYNQYDIEASKIINDFLPDKVFDMHMHVTHRDTLYNEYKTFADYYDETKLFYQDRKVRCNGIIMPFRELKNPEELKKSMDLLNSELDKYPDNVGETIVFPHDTVDGIKARLTHPAIRGLKCYCFYSERKDCYQSTIDEFLPESAWEVANEKKLAITLHIVKDEALAHPDNLNYIIEMSKKYPDAVLILAHAARAFASWTAFDMVDKLVDCENVWYDFSCICEVPAMLYILKKVGVGRCMWGTDYNVCTLLGKPISLADRFYWLYKENFPSDPDIRLGHIITEAFMAMRQTCILADMDKNQIEDFFYNNAARLVDR